MTLILKLRIISQSSNDTIHVRIQSPAVLSANLPEEFMKDWLPGSDISSATGEYGTMSTQRITVNGISMYYTVARLIGELNLSLTGMDSFFVVQINLRALYKMKSGSLLSECDHPNRYAVLSLAEKETHIRLFEQTELKTITIVYPLLFARSVLGYFPALEDLEENIRAGQNIVSPDHAISILLAEKIYGLLHTPFTPMREGYFQGLFTEVLQIFFSEYIPVKITLPFSLHDVDCIHAVKQHIDTHLLEHLTIAQLSRKAGINQLKLKKGFKTIYGIGVYGYQLQQRMLIAKTALEKTLKPIHQVGRQSGYRNTANFSAAFKKIYGISPYRYRAQMRQKS